MKPVKVYTKPDKIKVGTLEFDSEQDAWTFDDGTIEYKVVCRHTLAESKQQIIDLLAPVTELEFI